jgi:hypothetical protein
MTGDACEEVAQVGERIEGECFGGGNQTGQHGRRLASVVAAVKHSVPATTERFP